MAKNKRNDPDHATEYHGEKEIMRARKRIEYGQNIVADPEICHGKLTFKGTRIMVRDVLYYLAKGYDWDWISRAYDGRINHQAIAEAIEVAREALMAKTEKRRQAASPPPALLLIPLPPSRCSPRPGWCE